MVTQKNLQTWKKNYLFLEKILESSDRDIFKIEEGNLKEVLRCLPHGYHCNANGEQTTWQWYGVKSKKIKPLNGTSIGEVISKERFDYVVSVDDIDTPNFSDRSISIYPVTITSENDFISKNPNLLRFETSDMDYCIRNFAEKGFRITSARDIAIARMKEDDKNPIHNGSWVGEGVLYIEDNNAAIVKAEFNPRVKYANLSRFQEFQNVGFVNNLRIDNKSFDEIMSALEEDKDKNPEHRRAMRVSVFHGAIPLDKFESNELSLFLFGDVASRYAQYLSGKGIDSLPFYFPEEYMGITDSNIEGLVGAILGVNYESVGKSKSNRPFMDMLWIAYDNIHWKSKVIKNFRDAGSVCFYGIEDTKNGE